MFWRENVRAWTACSPQSRATAVIDSALCRCHVTPGSLVLRFAVDWTDFRHKHAWTCVKRVVNVREQLQVYAYNSKSRKQE
jgi:hypothetical protein